jgi:Hemolysin-type calcium-binding repeat (2 copies).
MTTFFEFKENTVDIFTSPIGNTFTEVWSFGGNDQLTGNSGSDYFHAGNGNDYLNGMAGDDVLDGGAGHDDIRGGSGESSRREPLDPRPLTPPGIRIRTKAVG